MEAIQSQAMSVETQRRRDVAKARIISALGRLEKGTYGDCVVCGEEIPERRLDHDPAAPTCLNCA
jgi:DnaK suppressor protein